MRDESAPKDEAARVSEPERLEEWETPELVVEDVQSATFGGTIGTVNSPGDDIWYES